MSRRRIHAALAAVAGSAAGLTMLELVLRCLASPGPLPAPDIDRDRLEASSVEYRQIEEGIAVSHFSSGGARLTGTPPVRDGRTVVILGDSYVAAQQVADDQTMGAALERQARHAGYPVNVRQYGWSGASPAQYLRVAPMIDARWHPAHVVIPIADNDLDFNATSTAWPALRVDSSGALRILGDAIHARAPDRRGFALTRLVRRRWADLQTRMPAWARPPANAARSATSIGSREALPDSAELAALPRAIVRALAQAYGPSLSLVYLAEVKLFGGEASTVIEQRLLDACRAEGVACASTRQEMLRARREGHVARGFSTNTPGDGHLNAVGHRIVANIAWQMIASDETPLAAR